MKMIKSYKYSKNWYKFYLLSIIFFFLSLFFSRYLKDPILPITIFSISFFTIWIINVFWYLLKSFDIQSYCRRNLPNISKKQKLSLFSIPFMKDYGDNELKKLLVIYKSRLVFLTIIFFSFLIIILIYTLLLNLIHGRIDFP